MANQRVQQQPAFVIHTRAYTESSLIVEIFTQDYGRLGLLAKGARNPKNYRRGFLQPFQPLLLSWTGRGELPILSSVEQDSKLLFFDYKSRVCGFYANELIYKLLHRRDPSPDIFIAYKALMSKLDLQLSLIEREKNLRKFEKELLAQLGYALILDRDIDNQELINPEFVYQYIPELGPKIYSSSSTHSPLIVSGMVLHCIYRDQYPNESLMQQAKQFMRYILQISLSGKVIHSRQLLYLS